MISRDKDDSQKSPAAGPPTSSRQIVVTENSIASRELFNGTREIIITHGDDSYRLRLTAQNKLILIK
jgi:hemin uptake protein HemP